MQRGPSYLGMLQQTRAARVQTGSGQRRFLIKEERDLQKALLSIQNFANNNLQDSYSATAPQTPSYYNPMVPSSVQKAQKLQELARRQRSHQEYNFVNQKPMSDHQGRSKLFSPKTATWEASGSYNNHRAKTSAGDMRSRSHSRSKSPQDDVSLHFSSTQKVFTDLQRGGDLGLESEMKDQVKVQQLLVNNNYSAMLKRVGHAKKHADLENAKHQSQMLVSTLHMNKTDQIFKGQKNEVLSDFVAETDANIDRKRSQIFKDDVWQIKNYVIKNIQTKIYHAEMIPPEKKHSASDLRYRDRASIHGAVKASKNSISPLRSQSGDRGNRAVSALGKIRVKSQGKFATAGQRGRRQDSIENSRKLQEERDQSYEKYVSSMANRVSMQQQISQNRIRVNYITEGVNTIKSGDDSMMNYDTILGTTKDLHLDSISTIRTTDDMFSPKLTQASAEFEERLIQDFITEREQFIQQHKKKNRLIFNMQGSSNIGSQVNVVDLGSMTVTEFLKNNKINPKIYLSESQYDGSNNQVNKREYFLTKSIHLLQTLKIKQARTFLINAVREFPFDNALLYNKGLVYMLNKEYSESARLFASLLSRISHRNLLLINMFQCLLHLKEYERIMDLIETVEKKEDYLDFNEKQLRMMGLLAREKLKNENSIRYQEYLRIQKIKREINASLNNQQPLEFAQGEAVLETKEHEIANSQVTFQMKDKINKDDGGAQRYLDSEDKEITIVDEGSRNQLGSLRDLNAMMINEDPIFNRSADDTVHFNVPTQHSMDGVQAFNEQNDFTLAKDVRGLQTSQKFKKDDSGARSSQQEVQFSKQFNTAFEQFQSNVNPVESQKQTPIKFQESISTMDDKQKTALNADLKEKQIQAEINALRKDCEGDDNTIEYLAKLWKRRNGSAKQLLSKREEFFLRKYRKCIAELLNPDTKYFYQRYIRPECEQYQKRRTTKVIPIDPQKLMMKEGDALREEEQKLMIQIGVPQDRIEDRVKRHFKKSVIAIVTNVQEKEKELGLKQGHSDFTEKTSNFIQFIFDNYAIREFIVPGSECATIYEDIRFVENLNSYVNQLSEFMTTKTVYLANDKQKMVNEEDAFFKQQEKRKKYSKGNGSDRSDTNIENDPAYEEFEDDKTQHQLENFQNILEMKYIEMLGNQNHEEANFYQGLLQKLNVIDLLQLYLKQCARKIKSGERMLTFKKELSFGMLQIFREEISKRMLAEAAINISDQREQQVEVVPVSKRAIPPVDYDMIDKTVRKLRFFKNFAQTIRLKLYQVCKYELIPPNRVIAQQEEFDSHIFVLISGIASLTVKYLETNEAYSGMLIYPGDAIGDANIKDKIVISKGRGEARTYISSVKECDVLVFDRRVFSDVLFRDMMDSLYEKIIAMRSSEFFENLSPYAMVILCSNVELHEYSYGDVILRQETEPLECFIIISGECKLVLETVIYKEKKEEQSSSISGKMKFGQNCYNPTEKYGKKPDPSKPKPHPSELADKKDRLINQRKLNEKFSFQHEKLDFPTEFDDKDRSSSPVLRAPVINETESPMFAEQKSAKKMIAYRHHLFYDKLVQGKVLCSRALLEKDYAKKFIHKKFDHFKEQLDVQALMTAKSPNPNHASPFGTASKKTKGKQQHQQEEVNPLNEDEQEMVNKGLHFKSPSKTKQSFAAESPFKPTGFDQSDSRDSRQLEFEREQEVEGMYQVLMKSQLTVIADQACVKVLKLTRKSKKYLSDPLKTMIDNRIFDTKFKDYDRPFKNEIDVQKFVNGQRQWEQFKEKLSKKITTAKTQNQLFK